jgi:NAD(P)-dependent dehydrogenase (short-subunit alcohol dehydrogenase family)
MALDGQVALVAGASRGIGADIAKYLAAAGAKVAVAARTEEVKDPRLPGTIHSVTKEIQDAGGTAIPVVLNMRDPESIKAAVKKVVDEWGRLDILVNNAAFQNRQPSLEEISLEQWDRTFRTNIYGYFHMARAALPCLKRGASIINTGSITGLEGNKQLLDYSSTKGAIHAFTKSLAQNLVEKGIRVNCVAPGPVWTPLNPSDNKTPEEVSHFGEGTPMERPA